MSVSEDVGRARASWAANRELLSLQLREETAYILGHQIGWKDHGEQEPPTPAATTRHAPLRWRTASITPASGWFAVMQRGQSLNWREEAVPVVAWAMQELENSPGMVRVVGMTMTGREATILGSADFGYTPYDDFLRYEYAPPKIPDMTITPKR